MAKKRSDSKSQAIRDYLATHPDAGPKAVQTALAKKGTDVSLPLVSKVKARGTTGKRKTARKKSARKSTTRRKSAKRATAQAKPLDELKHAGDLMMEAVELVMKVGAAEAKHLINSAADLVKRIRE